MNWRKHLLEAATLMVAAVVCALIANAVASRERKLAVVGGAGGARRAAGGPVQLALPAPAPAAQPIAIKPVPAGEVAGAAQKQPATKKSESVKPTTDNRQPTTSFAPHPDKPYIEIHGDDVAALHDKGVLFLDARRTSDYEKGHIPGARPFSVWESDIDEKVNKLYAERSDPRDQNLPIVIYCSGGDCEDSHMLAQKLWGIQFNNVYVYKDGFPDWQKRKPVHTGPTP
jgi:rhodanese-related sulfurtransferase